LIDIFVISLDDATERRENATRQLDALRMPFRFYDAVRAADALSDGHLEGCDEYDWLLNSGRNPTPGELGCFASHRNLWQTCVEFGRPILIMEDDFQLLDDFAGAVDEAGKQVERFGYLRLQTETRARHSHVADAGRFEVRRYTYAPHSLMCYAVTPEVAERWVELTATACEPVDVFVKKFWVHGQPLYGLYPSTVTESAFSIATGIRGRTEKPRKEFRTARRRFVNKIGWLWRRIAFNVRQRLA